MCVEQKLPFDRELYSNLICGFCLFTVSGFSSGLVGGGVVGRWVCWCRGGGSVVGAWAVLPGVVLSSFVVFVPGRQHSQIACTRKRLGVHIVSHAGCLVPGH